MCRSVSSDVITTAKFVLEPGQPVEREPDGLTPLGGDDPQEAPFVAQARQHLDDLPERLELVVQRLVVLAIGGDEIVDALRRERLHLGEKARPADGRGEHLLGDVAPEHGAGGVLHRGDDHRPRVDQRAIEVEENDGKPHARQS